MTIDILSRESCVPIVVGDHDDMAPVSGVSVAEDAVSASLKLLGSGGETVIHFLEISPETYQNFIRSDYSLLVSLSPTDDIVSAVLCPVSTKPLPSRPLDEAEIKALAKHLVSGEFRLDFLR